MVCFLSGTFGIFFGGRKNDTTFGVRGTKERGDGKVKSWTNRGDGVVSLTERQEAKERGEEEKARDEEEKEEASRPGVDVWVLGVNLLACRARIERDIL